MFAFGDEADPTTRPDETRRDGTSRDDFPGSEKPLSDLPLPAAMLLRDVHDQAGTRLNTSELL
jgi:hypothetical protein